jgi:undecaprenyl-diphosphatase
MTSETALDGAVPAPGADRFGPAVAAFDDWCDRLLEPLRGHAVSDQLFTAASKLGDFSVIWHLAAVARGATSKQRAKEAVILAALIGAESLIVNQGVKRLFGRHRPTPSGDERLVVRQPSTSSFPSGHASSAAFAAILLAARSQPAVRPVWYSIATVVALSRVYVRIHHASDVVAGAVVGTALAGIARRTVWR